MPTSTSLTLFASSSIRPLRCSACTRAACAGGKGSRGESELVPQTAAAAATAPVAAAGLARPSGRWIAALHASDGAQRPGGAAGRQGSGATRGAQLPALPPSQHRHRPWRRSPAPGTAPGAVASRCAPSRRAPQWPSALIGERACDQARTGGVAGPLGSGLPPHARHGERPPDLQAPKARWRGSGHFTHPRRPSSWAASALPPSVIDGAGLGGSFKPRRRLWDSHRVFDKHVEAPLGRLPGAGAVGCVPPPSRPPPDDVHHRARHRALKGQV